MTHLSTNSKLTMWIPFGFSKATCQIVLDISLKRTTAFHRAGIFCYPQINLLYCISLIKTNQYGVCSEDFFHVFCTAHVSSLSILMSSHIQATKLAHVSLAGPVLGYIPKLTLNGSDGSNLLSVFTALQALVMQASYFYFLCYGLPYCKRCPIKSWH